MERTLRRGGALLIAALALATALLLVPACQAHATTYTTVTVASEDIESDSSAAIQEALDEAADNATSSNQYKVVIEDGSYTLDATLRIYSNTYLDAAGCTLTQTSSVKRNMIKIGDTEDTNKGYYYTNITIYGGTWNENGNSSTLIKLAHASNVTVSKCTFKNVKNAHLMEVAGINGLTISSCTFKDQTMSTSLSESAQTPEAIQLDILTSDHFSGYLYQDLALKTVKITGCTFSNVPRAIGSHTTVLNNPINGLTITNNTIKSTGSAGIQLMNVKNCTISGNTLTSVARGIAIYSYRESAKGVYSSTILENEGGVSSSTSNSYTEPTSSRSIVIKNNTIKLSGSSDKYGDYESTAIYLYGLNLSSKKTSSSQGTIPAGNYYLKGVTISGNTITASKGNGIRIYDSRAVTVSSNTLTGSTTSSTYGISAYGTSKSITIKSNTVKKFYRGIYFYGSSTSSAIQSNKVSSSKHNGIMIQKATVTTLKSNTVSSAGATGIYVYSSAKVTNLTSNKVTSAGKYGIDIDAATATNVKSNTVSSPKSVGIYVYKGAKVTTLSSNKITSAGKYGIDVEKSTCTTIKSNTISKAKSHGIYIYTSSKVKTISSNTITSCTKRAISVHSLKCSMTISSNTIKSCGGSYMIYLNPGTKSYKITVKSNKVTGASSKKVAGLRIDTGKASITKNTFKSCSYPIIYNKKSTASISGNKYSGNKYNKVKKV